MFLYLIYYRNEALIDILFSKYSVGTTVEGRELAVLKLTGGVARERPLLRPLVKERLSYSAGLF